MSGSDYYSDNKTDSDSEYEVEAIRDRRVRDGKIQYLIKWKNWPEISNTWEDESNLEGCRELLADFLKKRFQKKKKEKKSMPIKVLRAIDQNGITYVTFLCSDKSEKSMLKAKAVRNYPELYFAYLQKHAAFRIEA